MIRFAWLQSRTQTVVAVGALAIVAIIVAFTGPHLHHLYDANVATCGTPASCDIAKAGFLKNDKNMYSWFGGLLLVVPVIIGLFWGPPLVARELEAGTFRLAWTQSVTRTRWFAVKLAVVGIIAMAVTGLLSLMITWWASPIDTVRADRFSPPLFDERGIVVIGFTAFALVVGVTAGVVIRRTLPAMATALVVIVATKVAVIQWIRPKYLAAAHRAFALDPTSTGFGRRNSGPLTLQPETPRLPDAWIHSVNIVDKAGHGITPTGLARLCPRLDQVIDPPPPQAAGDHVRVIAPEGAKSAIDNCVTQVGKTFHLVVKYHPAKDYWTFQWIELVFFIAAALALSGFCFWWIRRRLV
jgi:hypothetical protein